LSYNRISANTEQPSWYVIHTRPQEEARAESNLRGWGIETFLPKAKERRKRTSPGAAPSYYVTPLFARYLFARFKADELLYKVTFTRGVHSVVNFGGWPTPVDDEVVELLRNQSDGDGCVRLGEELKKGDKVVISRGPFRNLIGVLEGKAKAKGQDRVTLLLTAVNWQSRVSLDRQLVKKIA
jgi:transcriptional antiterminator RfaH